MCELSLLLLTHVTGEVTHAADLVITEAQGTTDRGHMYEQLEGSPR